MNYGNKPQVLKYDRAPVKHEGLVMVLVAYRRTRNRSREQIRGLLEKIAKGLNFYSSSTIVCSDGHGDEQILLDY